MNISLESKVKILEYKLAFEKEKIVSKEFEDGNSDLNFRLSFFREKIKDSSHKGVSQKEVYDNIFQTGPKDKDIVVTDKRDDMQKSSKKNTNIDKWARKTYIRIAKSTHPDVTMHINSEVLRNKFDTLFEIAQNAYEKKLYSDLIMVAHDLEIDVPEKEVEKNIVSDLKKKANKIKDISGKLGWQWYHVPEENKDAELKKILLSMGFVFTEDKIQEVIKTRKPQRRTGQRPQKINVKRKRLK
jgi:hypothetical protein